MKKSLFPIIALVLVIGIALLIMTSVFAADGKWVNNQRVALYPCDDLCVSEQVNTSEPSQGEVLFNDPMGNVTLVIQGNVEGLSPKHEYAVWVRDLTGYTGDFIMSAGGWFWLETFTTNKQGKGKFHINILSEDLPTGTYDIQLAINDPDADPPFDQYGCTVLATPFSPMIEVTIKTQ